MTDLKDRKPAFAGSRSFLKNGYFLIIVCVFLIYIYYLGTRLVLAIVPEGNKDVITIPSYIGDRWHISFTHSVEKTAWDEFFTVNGPNDMTMTHTRFQSLGWGYPYSANDGVFSRTDDDRFQLIMNRSYKEIPLRISEQAMQNIIHGQQSYDLVALYGQGTALTIKSMYRYQYWLKYYF